MTLYQLLCQQGAEHASNAILCVGNERKHAESMGRARMCEELINLLSDKTLKTEAITRAEFIEKGATNAKL